MNTGLLDGKQVGQHTEVCALVSGIVNDRLPRPSYMFKEIVESVIN